MANEQNIDPGQQMRSSSVSTPSSLQGVVIPHSLHDIEFERLYETEGQSDAINPSHNENVVCFDCSDGSRNALVVS